MVLEPIPIDQFDFGYPNFRLTALKEYETFWRIVPRLHGLAERILEAEPKGKLARVTIEILKFATNSFDAVMVLVGNGCGPAAQLVVRPMFEAAVNGAFLRGAPLEELEDFLGFYWVRQKARIDYLTARGLTPAIADSVNTEYAKVKGRFVRGGGNPRKRWSKMPFSDILSSLKLDHAYAGYYAKASDLVHGNWAGLMYQMPNGEHTIAASPSLIGTGEALWMAHAMMILAMENVNEVLQLQENIAWQYEIFKHVWPKDTVLK